MALKGKEGRQNTMAEEPSNITGRYPDADDHLNHFLAPHREDEPIAKAMGDGSEWKTARAARKRGTPGRDQVTQTT